MARQTPRFLFSNPQNTKGKGPFIVHCIFPRFIAKIIHSRTAAKPIDYKIVDQIDEVDPENLQKVIKQMDDWVHYQKKNGSIEFEVNDLDYNLN